MTNPRDLAGIITVAVREIVTTAAPTEVWNCIEAYLRDQLAEFQRQVIADRRLDNDDA
jgi:hypothetical protein